MPMANALRRDKKVAVRSILLEGSSVRSAERITGLHRDTILRLMVRVGEAWARFSDQTLINLNCDRNEVDEIGAFVQKNNKIRTRSRDPWTP